MLGHRISRLPLYCISATTMCISAEGDVDENWLTAVLFLKDFVSVKIDLSSKI